MKGVWRWDVAKVIVAVLVMEAVDIHVKVPVVVLVMEAVDIHVKVPVVVLVMVQVKSKAIFTNLLFYQ